MKQSELFAQVKAMGLSIRKTDYDEYRIAHKSADLAAIDKGSDTEPSAAYVDVADKETALAQARAMADWMTRARERAAALRTLARDWPTMQRDYRPAS